MYKSAIQTQWLWMQLVYCLKECCVSHGYRPLPRKMLWRETLDLFCLWYRIVSIEKPNLRSQVFNCWIQLRAITSLSFFFLISLVLYVANGGQTFLVFKNFLVRIVFFFLIFTHRNFLIVTCWNDDFEMGKYNHHGHLSKI